MSLRIYLLMMLILAAPAIAGQIDALLKTNPELEAEQAFGANDQRFIVVPICGEPRGEVLPGWPLQFSPAHLEALEKGKRPITCKDLGNDPQHIKASKVVKWAEKYNLRLLHLQGKT